MGLLDRVNIPAAMWGAASIIGVPLGWTIVARNEYRRHTLEKLFGSKKVGAYFLAFAIFAAAAVRDYAVLRAMRLNPELPIVSPDCAKCANCPAVRWAGGASAVLRGMKVVGGALVAAGTTFVVTSFLRLGVLGTYLGDYFGILMEERVTGFPFNVLENPMYMGAVMNWLGLSLQNNSALGLLYTVLVWVVYQVVLAYETPFTAQIYANRSA